MDRKDFEDDLSEMGIKKYQFKSRTMRFLDKYFPFLVRWIFFLFAKFSIREVSALDKEMLKSKSIDIFPGYGKGRGFVLVIDQKKALYFYQDGDHFSYDGCEVGEYEKGDVTIFDNATS